MPKRGKNPGTARPQPQADSLKGWQRIAGFLGQPVSVAQRWTRTGLPVTRQGRFVIASPQELTDWLGRESGGEPVRVATEASDLSSELKRGLSFIRREKQQIAASRKSTKN
jgi:hypothetical protein